MEDVGGGGGEESVGSFSLERIASAVRALAFVMVHAAW